MAEGLDEKAGAGNNRILLVGNLPPNCEEQFIENFFESRRNFGDGICVEHVDIQNGMAIVTFSTATAVEHVLQRHSRNPCTLGRKELTLRPQKSNDDDDSSFVVLDENESVGISSGNLETYSGLACSLTSLASSQMFGSGDEKYPCFRHYPTEIHLKYQLPSEVETKRSVELCTTDSLPVLVGYALTTEISESTTTEGSGNLSETVLANRLNKIFDGAVSIEEEDANPVLTLREGIKTINSIDDFERKVFEIMKTLEEYVTVRLLQLNDDETFEFAVKHFLPVVRNNPRIKLYRTGNRCSFYIAFQGNNDKKLIDEHIAVIKDQKIVEQEKHIELSDYWKINAEKSSFEAQNALVTIRENRVLIRGFQEDVVAASCHLNKVLETYTCVTKTLDDFAITLLNYPEVRSEVKETLKSTNLNVWWELSGLLINVVSKNEKQATEAARLIENYFCIRKIDIPGYLLDSMEWQQLKSFAFVNSRKHHDCTRLLIDDVSERPLVIIKGTTTECNRFADTANRFVSRCKRVSREKKLTLEKCDFLLIYLRSETESQNTDDFLRINPNRDKAIVIAEGTESALTKFESKLSKVSTQKFWIYDDSAADVLKRMSENKDCGWGGTVHIYENHTKICLKTGRIEEQKVDVLVNSAGKDLQLDTGNQTVTQSLRAAAGEEAQKSLQLVKRPVPIGTVVVGTGGNLPCKAIFHAVLESFNTTNKVKNLENLKRAVTSCLDQATKAGYEKIAFPALCTGVHQYPVIDVANAMFDAIIEYCIRDELFVLKEINIVFLELEPKKRKIFEDRQNERRRQMRFHETQQKKLLKTLPWPSRYFCHITAASSEMVTQLVERLNSDLKHETFVKTV